MPDPRKSAGDEMKASRAEVEFSGCPGLRARGWTEASSLPAPTR
jgi:hypothetical protein